MLIPPDHHASWRRNGVIVLARGDAASSNIADVRGGNRTSFYADPVAWLVAQAVTEAVDDCAADLHGVADDVATITISDFCTILTMRHIAAQVPAGRLSPLRFSAATPGTVGSLPAMTFGFKGPSLTLSMAPHSGLRVAIAVAGSWLRTRLAAFAILSSHEVDAAGRHSVHSVIIAVGPDAEDGLRPKARYISRHRRELHQRDSEEWSMTDLTQAPPWFEADGLTPVGLDGFLGEVVDADATPGQGLRTGPGTPLQLVTALPERLRSSALRRGAIVMIALPNSIEMISCLFAVLQAGYVPAPIPPSTPLARAKRIALHLGAAALIRTHVPLMSLAECRVTRFADLDMLEFLTHPHTHHESGQVILLTSGTSGTATACLHDTGTLLRNARQHAESIGLRRGDRMLVNLPIHYSFALVAQVLAGLQSGAGLVLAGPPFSAGRYAQTLREYQITVSSLTPLLVSEALIKAGTRLPEGLRVFTVGGAALPAEHAARLVDENPGTEIYLTYGLTEAGPRVTTLAAHEEPRERYSSVGRPLPGVDLSLRDVGCGEQWQEVMVRSDTVCKRRLGLVAGSGCSPLDEQGRLATGDLGYIDDDGYLFLRGRLSDFVLVRGEKVSLASVKQAAESLDGVVRAVPKVKHASDSALLELDLYVDNERMLGDTATMRRQLSTVLLFSERPSEIRIHLTPSQPPYK